MAAIRTLSRTSGKILLVIMLLMQKAYAEAKYKVKLLFNLLTQNGDEGKQIYDNSGHQELHVFEPMIFVEQKIDEHTNINAMFIFDAWTAASDTKLDGKTGASGEGIKQQSRVAGKLGMGATHQSHSWSGNLGVSSEYDYRSLNFGGHYAKSFAEDNFTLAIAPQLYLDQAAAFSVEQAQTTAFKSRLIYSTDISASQILTVSDVIQLGYTHIALRGMLNNISNTVKVLDITTNPYSRTAERLPDNRKRHAFYTRLVHAFSDAQALFLNYRYYTDSWDVRAHTYEINQRISFSDDQDFLLLSYRHYRQQASRYHGDEFPTSRQFMTSDSDMDTLESHRYGIHLSHLSEKESIFSLKVSEVEYSSAIYYSQRSNGLYDYILQMSMGAAF